jgi:hypothetical protein
MLINGDFEADWSIERSHKCLKINDRGDVVESEEGSIFTPPGWLVWYRVEEGKLAIPEGRVACGTNPERMHGGEYGYMLFSSAQAHESGLLQEVAVKPGDRVRFSAWAHAWSNHHDPENPNRFPHPDDSRWSEGPGHDPFFALQGDQIDDGSLRNITFWLGIDPTGGNNPFSSDVIWGPGAYIYNVYAQVPAIEATAQSERITVFTRARARFPFKHNDAYWDDAELTVASDDSDSAIVRGTPRIQYERFYVLLPPGASEAWARAVVQATWDDHRYTVGGSADDAGIGDLDSRIVLAINPDLWGGPDVLTQFFAENYPGVRLRSVKAETPEELIILLKEK